MRKKWIFFFSRNVSLKDVFLMQWSSQSALLLNPILVKNLTVVPLDLVQLGISGII